MWMAMTLMYCYLYLVISRSGQWERLGSERKNFIIYNSASSRSSRLSGTLTSPQSYWARPSEPGDTTCICSLVVLWDRNSTLRDSEISILGKQCAGPLLEREHLSRLFTIQISLCRWSATKEVSASVCKTCRIWKTYWELFLTTCTTHFKEISQKANNKPKTFCFLNYIWKKRPKWIYSQVAMTLRLLATSSRLSVDFSFVALNDIPVGMYLQCSSATVTAGK